MANEDRYVLETPENIHVEFEIAGLGSRFCAMLIDTIWISLAVAAIVLVFVLFASETTNWIDAQRRHWAGWIVATLLIVIVALIFDGYFILFELVMGGQTPGKKSMKIRVVRDDGTPVGANEVLIRNLIRIVDFLPSGYALGAIVMFPSPLAKRLGDIAAGTIVVKEGALDYRARADKNDDPVPTITSSNAELTAEERRLVTGFLRRRLELLPEARDQLAVRLAQPLFEKYGGQFADPERYLELLSEGRHHES
jgi:uncharacterized RDD family membrane protein YckC